jgi:hypothetical protein
VLVLAGVGLGSAATYYVRYRQDVKREKGMSNMGWVASSILLITLVLLTGYGIVTYGRYRTLVQNGERIIANIQPGTLEEDLVDFLERNKEELGIYSWKSTERKGEQYGLDDEYWYTVWFKGGATLWELLGQKSYLSIRIDGAKKEVRSILWGFQ